MMKRLQPALLRLFVSIFWIALLTTSQGCKVGGGGYSSTFGRNDPYNNINTRPQFMPPPPQTIEEADNIIAHQQKMVTDLQHALIEKRIQNALNAKQNIDSDGAVKLVGTREDTDVFRNSNAEVIGYETEIVRLKKVIKQAKETKAKLRDQSIGCFLPDTLIQMGDGSLKPFVEIIPGDKVMGYDIGHEKQVSRSVLKLYSVESNHLYKINNEFETTGGERLLTQDGWKEINSLKKGDFIHVNGEMIEVFAIEFDRSNHRLYNMQVNNIHNFYVSTASGAKYLVHNCGGGGGGGK